MHGSLSPSAQSNRVGRLGPAFRQALPVVPACAFLIVFFGIPIAAVLAPTLGNWSNGPYAHLISESIYIAIIWRTIVIAAIVTAICLIISYPTAYALAMAGRFWRTIGFVAVMIPLWTSVVVRNYAWMVILGRNGILNRSLIAAGIIEQPITLLNTQIAVIIGMVHVMIPFMILPIYAAIEKVDRDLPLAASGLGAGPFRIFREVHLPLTMRGIMAGSTLVFVTCLGFYITPALLGGGKVTMIAMVIEQQVRTFLDWKLAGALSAVLLLATLLVIGIPNAIAARKMRV